jgi:CBS domain-containing protein
VNVFFEGDLIRPLGLVTLYFGYAEFEVDALNDALVGVGLAVDMPRNSSLGQKLAVVREVLSRQKIPEASQLTAIVDEVRPLVELRNILVHSSIVAGGRVRPSEKTRSDIRVTPEQLTKLADTIFTWKERLSVSRQLQLMPALQRMEHNDT